MNTLNLTQTASGSHKISVFQLDIIQSNVESGRPMRAAGLVQGCGIHAVILDSVDSPFAGALRRHGVATLTPEGFSNLTPEDREKITTSAKAARMAQSKNNRPTSDRPIGPDGSRWEYI